MAGLKTKSRKMRKAVKKPRVRRRVNRRLKVAGQLAPHVHNIVVNNNMPVSRMEQRSFPVVPRQAFVTRSEERGVGGIREMRDQATQTVFATRQDAYFAGVVEPAPDQVSVVSSLTEQYEPQFPGHHFQGSSVSTGSVHYTALEDLDDLNTVDSPVDGQPVDEQAITPQPLLAPPPFLASGGSNPRFLNESLALSPEYVQRLDNIIERLDDDGTSSSSSTSDERTERAERAERYMMSLNDVNYALRRGTRVRRPRVPFTPT